MNDFLPEQPSISNMLFDLAPQHSNSHEVKANPKLITKPSNELSS